MKMPKTNCVGYSIHFPLSNNPKSKIENPKFSRR
jgi:hypothetical protein